MKLSLTVVAVTLLFPAVLFSQIRWQTTHNGTAQGECQLEISKLRLTVCPFHVDVEEEAVIATTGTVWWGDSSTLEIFGEFSLTKGAAIRSLLLWNGPVILKGKLKDRAAADSAYEKVVDRTKPQVVVRDPALIEYLGNDRYRIKIFPVRINNSRKIRILYSIPFQTTGSGPQFEIKPAFLPAFTLAPTQIPVEIRKAASLSTACIIRYGSTAKTIQFGVTYQIPVSTLLYRPNTWSAPIVTPLCIAPDTTFKITAFSTRIDSGKAPGHYTAVFATLPDTIRAGIRELPSKSSYSVEAKIVAGEKSYITDFNQMSFVGAYIKSGAPWDSTIHWYLYNSQGKIAVEYGQRTVPSCDSLTRSMLPLVWGAKYSLVEGNGQLGALFGFVDGKMSLLALESDSLPATEAQKWADAGVPPLTGDEIILKPAQMPAAPGDNIIFEIATAVRIAKADALSIAAVVMMPNRMFRITFSKPVTGTVHVVLYDISGKVLATWNNVRPAGGIAECALPRNARGCMVVRVYAGKEMLQKKFVITQ
ncbi:MAG: hypothetical protein JXA71_18620 [Chitinispirillaceae bacterium]|nr:hypothetical protein [Chitinispirillaceae bacterium]